MISLDEARAEVLGACAPAGASTVEVEDALGLVLAEAVTSPSAVPPFRNSAMDGYAVHAADVAQASAAHPARLRVIGTLAAGRPPAVAVGSGEALRIMTGAVFPDGADAVAIVETTRTDGDQVEVSAPVEVGRHIRAPGSDIRAGAEVLPAGALLGPAHLGVLASVGCRQVVAVPAPVVGVLSTGDELVDGGGELRPGQIRDSNRATLLALLRRDGFVPVDLGIAPDDEAAIERALREGVERCDALLTSGGVSMGDYDYVKAVLERIGKMRWMQVAIRPAKPFAFGVVGATPVFGLPGNPVSSMVSYELLARPGLRRLGGHAASDLVRPAVAANLEGVGWAGGDDGRTAYVRVAVRVGADGGLLASNAGGQGSHQLQAMARADGLAVCPPGSIFSPGDRVQVLLLRP